VINNRDQTIINKFGENLRKLRKIKGFSQEELTFRADLSKNMVGNIERGEVNPTLTTIVTLANALEVSKAELMNY
jgi:transcriptional regulator with XRE-family HTH domain